MASRRTRRRVLATALALALASANQAAAAGWEMHDFETPLGDKGVALRVVSKRFTDVHLAIACDGATGTRWRGVTIVEEPESKAGLGMSGDVRIHFGEVSARDVWQVRTTVSERRIFMAAESTKFARRLLRAAAESPSAEVTIDIPGIGGKPVPLSFPLAGLKDKIATLSARCADWDIEEK